ncbi:ribonuclease E/G [Clostridium folliculivorans]|uniref:Ribonuclease n=1 Tax=Clostridium folliculivorans TaxID=2886038 RepID=A0A9W6D7Y7_9CLOT|nr:ribonuclease E/G [Clostridium folliculivorans]GKU23400.1 ribonuclease [Clostridium folliculivorans]GKU29517.1 ribonuclease [Clostridium folliculivorans]
MRELFIERREKILRIAIKEKGNLTECFVEEENNEPLPGEVYKGTVKNIVPAIGSAFVDIGHEKNGYLHFDMRKNPLKKGQDLIVEIISESFGSKGPKVASPISLPGRFAVLAKGDKELLISKRIEDKDIRENLKSTIETIEGFSITIRTNAKDVSTDIIKQEIYKLKDRYEAIEREALYSLKNKKLYGEDALLHKVLRDNINSETSKIIVDSMEDYSAVKDYIADDKNIELIIHKEIRSLFDYYGIEKEILNLRNSRVNLKCGGNIVIDKTEAMYVIDVNSAKNISGRNFSKTAEETNIEAAKEIGRQIRLRNLSGIIVVDFIDMDNSQAKNKVYAAIKESLEGDSSRARVYEFTELNLLQISRSRRGKSIYDYIEENCDICNGHGKRLKGSYIKHLIKNEIIRTEGEGSIKDFYIELKDVYEDYVIGDKVQFLKDIGALDKNVYIKFIDSIDYYKLEPLLFKNQIDAVSNYKLQIE